ncbi:MAG TPA: hypothetical protein PLG43_13560, partial [Spirochaetia bacterium]|nr:hypothetical protein [Spirochaetia bacterium]
VELRASTPFSSWNMRAAGFSRYGVLAFSVQAEADEAVERRVSIERWGGRRFFHWYEQYVDDPHLHLAGMRSLADSDGIGVIQNLTCGASAFRVRIICDEGGLHPLTRVLNSRCVEYCFSPSEKSSFLVLVAVRTASGDDAEDCANAEACAAIEEAAGCADIFTEIKNEWRRFWSASFVRLEDRFLDTVYHQALYRMNSSFKAPLPSLFSGGAWAWNRDIRNWGHLYHWNQQQCYWGLHAAGHPELVSPWLEYRFRMLPRAIEDGVRLFGIEGAFFSDIADLDGHQAVEPDTVRNLGPTALVALDFHRAWLYGKDTTFLRERSYPVVQACARLFAGIFRREDDGYIRPFGGSSPFESYLVLRDNPVDRAAAEALFSAAAEEAEALGEFLAEEGHGEDYHAEAARWKNILRSLSPWCTTEEVFSDGILRRIFSAGRGADGKPLRYGEGTYPFSPFPAAQISPVFPFSVVGLDDAGSASPEARKLYEIALNTILLTVERDGKASGPLGFTAHTPLVQACARVGLAAEAYELI